MPKRETKNYDQSQIVAQGKERTTTNNGRGDSSKKSSKGSNQKRRENGRGRNGAKNQRDASRRQVFKVSEVLSQDIITKLDALKGRIK